MHLHAKMREIVIFAGVPEKNYDTLLKYIDSEIVTNFLQQVHDKHYKAIKSYIDDFPIPYWERLDNIFGKSATDEQRILNKEKKNLRMFWRENIKNVKSTAKQDLSRKNTERLQSGPETTGSISSDS